MESDNVKNIQTWVDKNIPLFDNTIRKSESKWWAYRFLITLSMVGPDLKEIESIWEMKPNQKKFKKFYERAVNQRIIHIGREKPLDGEIFNDEDAVHGFNYGVSLLMGRMDRI